MKTRFASLALLATSIAALSAFSASADQANNARPMFGVIPANVPWHAATDKVVKSRKPAAQITQWNGSFTDHHSTNRTFTMIGTDPTSTNTNTTIPVEVVPVIFKYPSFGKMKFSPKKDKYSDGETVLNNFLNSPLLDTNVDFQSGGVDFGKSQYIDAFQRANFYGNNVQNESNYHVVLGSPTVLKPLKITVQSGQGVVETNPFGSQKIGTYGYSAMDQQINSYIRAHSQVTPDQFVFFISHNIFLTSGGCCIGGYHTATGSQPGGQTYGYTTLVTEAGSFSQDVSAASHEIGEWLDDPFTDNRVGCQDNSILEVGDPLEGRSNYGGFPYQDHGFTYNMQDLVFIDYFGAPDTWPVNKLKSFNKLETAYCPGQ
ncbi:MAG TPA: hypothetical protein VHW69_14260 [Rhizomicrobium sp.]|jgi:hypothetical protein|nr:hypothetical protein [Rhizomicrobium sp.]